MSTNISLPLSNSIPWFGPEMTGNELSRLHRVLDSNYINDGPLTREMEKKIANYCGANHGVAVTSGTMAITAALMALGIGVGDEVLVPDLTFIATANAVTLTGATVVLVDVEPERFCIDIEACRKALTSKTKAIVAVDVNGRGADYGHLQPFCLDHGLKLVCDAAEALGSKYDGKAIGSFGEAACFSFSANKTVTTGQGGMVLTNDPGVAQRLIELKDQGREKRGTGGDDCHSSLGFNFKFTDLQAAVGLSQFAVVEERLSKMQNRDRLYVEALGGLKSICLPDFHSQLGEVRQWMDILVQQKRTLIQVLERHGIGVRAFWHPLHTQAPYANNPEKFPVASDISRRGLWLPSSFSITSEQIKFVASVLAKHP